MLASAGSLRPSVDLRRTCSVLQKEVDLCVASRNNLVDLHLKAVDLVQIFQKSAECCKIRRFSHKAAHFVRPADSAKVNQRANFPNFCIYVQNSKVHRASKF